MTGDWASSQWPYNAASQTKCLGAVLNIEQEVLVILDEAMSLKGRGLQFSRDTVLLGALPELDSMAVLAIISGLEVRLGLTIDDDDIDGAVFATVGTLVDFTQARFSG